MMSMRERPEGLSGGIFFQTKSGPFSLPWRSPNFVTQLAEIQIALFDASHRGKSREPYDLISVDIQLSQDLLERMFSQSKSGPFVVLTEP